MTSGGTLVIRGRGTHIWMWRSTALLAGISGIVLLSGLDRAAIWVMAVVAAGAQIVLLRPAIRFDGDEVLLQGPLRRTTLQVDSLLRAGTEESQALIHPTLVVALTDRFGIDHPFPWISWNDTNRGSWSPGFPASRARVLASINAQISNSGT